MLTGQKIAAAVLNLQKKKIKKVFISAFILFIFWSTRSFSLVGGIIFRRNRYCFVNFKIFFYFKNNDAKIVLILKLFASVLPIFFIHNRLTIMGNIKNIFFAFKLLDNLNDLMILLHLVTHKYLYL